MSTSVKMSRETKRLLDTLQARLVLATGRKYSQQELLDMALRLSSERPDELLKLEGRHPLPLTPEEVDRIMESPIDWGVETKEGDIDPTLYGRRDKKPSTKDDK